MNCPKCNATLPDQAKFCLECGAATGMSGASGQEADVSLGGLPTMAAGAPRDVAGAAEISIGGMLTMATAPAAQTSAGQVLAERYELLEEIGRGGFATVWKARDRKLDRVVAVKRLLPTAVEGPLGRQTLERFAREAASIAQLSHRNIVQVFDHDRDGEARYVVMEYIGGGSLRDRLKAHGGKLPVEEAVELVKGIARGLAYAHRKNLVHRDIKPANILLAPPDPEPQTLNPDAALPTPKIVDFGLARAGGESEVSVSGFGMGTPWYMPPEQRRNAKGVNHTADIYALGKTLYELVSGETPDNVDSEKVPPFLAKIILKCCKSNPEERFFSCEELLTALEGETRGRMSEVGGRTPEKEGNLCPSCNATNLPDVKFCVRCGGGLMRICPECQRENSIHQQFCGGCGTDVEGFLKAQEALVRMERAASEKRWSRVVKEAQLLAEAKPRLPGKQGQALLVKMTKQRRAAEQAQTECGRLQQEAEKQAKQGDFAAALIAAGRLRELDPHDAPFNEYAETLGQAHSWVERAEAALASGDLAGVQAARDALLASPGTQDGAQVVAAGLDARVAQYQQAREQARQATDGKRFEAAIAALNVTLAIAPGDEAVAREKRECEATLLRIRECLQRANGLRQKDNAAALAACRQVLVIDPAHTTARRYLEGIEAYQAQAAELRRQAEAAMTAKRPHEALAFWRQAQELDEAGCKDETVGERAAAETQAVAAALQQAHAALAQRQIGAAERLARPILSRLAECGEAQAILAACGRIRRRRRWLALAAGVTVVLGAAIIGSVRQQHAAAGARERTAYFARVDAAIEEARLAKAAGHWLACVAAAERVLGLEADGRKYTGDITLAAIMTEAKELKSQATASEKQSRLDAILVAARRAKAAGKWSDVFAQAEAALALETGHTEAAALKREAEGNLAPTLIIAAEAGGREVAAEVSDGRQAWQTPATISLRAGVAYHFTVTYSPPSTQYPIPDTKYRPVNFSFKADWRGPQTRRVTLEGHKEPDPGDTQTVDLGGGEKLELVWCPPGTFTMGSPSTETGRYDDEAQHRVTLTKGFWMGKYEVTQGQWEAVMGINPSHFKNAGRMAPVEQVSWDDCQEFVRKVNARVAGGGFRLPTEAEWEYACRAGTATALNNGKELTSTTGRCPNLDEVAWYDETSGRTTHPAGEKHPNVWGLYDMHGNVWEWCEDWYSDYPSGNETDPKGPGSGSSRVFRGGSWSNIARFCRSAYRLRRGPGNRIFFLGLRLARSPQ